MNESLLWQIRHFIMANPFSGIPTDFKWCAIESGAHAYAIKNGHYTSLSTWGKDSEGNLVGTLEMPMAVGIVAGWTLIAEKVVRIDRAEEILKALSGK